MKKQMLSALWACFVVTTFSVQAKEPNDNKQFRDTILFVPDANTKVLLIGDDMRKMVNYSRLDSLKTMLIDDIQKAQKQQAYPEDPHTTHYFVSETGKRRLKADADDYIEPEVNVQNEKRLLELSLPSYVFIIHDFSYDYEIRIYTNDPKQLNALSNSKLDESLSLISADKKIQRNSYRIELERQNNNWVVKDTKRSREDLLELTPSFGIGLIGNQWSPSVGGDIFLQFTNKYALPTYKVGFGLSAYTFSESNDLDFHNVNFVSAYSVKLLRNIRSLNGPSTKARWVGLEGGWLKTTEPASLNKAYKVGFLGQGFSAFDFSFDVIFMKEKKTVYGVTMLFPF